MGYGGMDFWVAWGFYVGLSALGLHGARNPGLRPGLGCGRAFGAKQKLGWDVAAPLALRQKLGWDVAALLALSKSWRIVGIGDGYGLS